ncbi:hypothetical protein JCM19000A_20390 [Silvimonas sp. JCM 19000]
MPGVLRPNRRAAASAAIGVMERALATAPISAEASRLRIFIVMNSVERRARVADHVGWAGIRGGVLDATAAPRAVASGRPPVPLSDFA